MPAFGDPFAGNVTRKISKEELIQAIRLDIAGELEAIYIYDAHVLATDDPWPKVLADTDEEKAHVGELVPSFTFGLKKLNILLKASRVRKCWGS